MTRDEVINLLTAAAAYDKRKPDAATLAAWSETARRARWTFDLALDAIHEHYMDSTEFVMPAHITRKVQAARRAAVERDHAASLAAEPAVATDPQIGLPIGGADGEPVWSSYDEHGAIELPCRTCRAEPDHACVNLATGATRKLPCTSRLSDGAKRNRAKGAER